MPVSTYYLLSAIFSFAILVWALHIQKEKRESVFSLLSLLLVTIHLGYFALSASSSLEEAALAYKITFLDATILPYFIIVCTLKICGIRRPKTVVLLFIPSVITYLLGLTARYSDLFYKDLQFFTEDGYSYLVRSYGPLHWLETLTVGLLAIAACDYMKQCFGTCGRVFRIGGDEFVALLKVDKNEIEPLVGKFLHDISLWRGKLSDNLSAAVGYVYSDEKENISLREMAVLADKRMYASKESHYRGKGVDRQGQLDAHRRLCDLYTKILKINITRDSYDIINMNRDEMEKAKGFSDKISTWLTNFGESGQVHPDDLAVYLQKTDLDYIGSYFKAGNDSLHIIYRRKYADEYKNSIMEIVPTDAYTSLNQELFLYVKEIEQ